MNVKTADDSGEYFHNGCMNVIYSFEKWFYHPTKGGKTAVRNLAGIKPHKPRVLLYRSVPREHDKKDHSSHYKIGERSLEIDSLKRILSGRN